MVTKRKMTSSSGRLNGRSPIGRDDAGIQARSGFSISSRTREASPGIAGTLSVIWHANVRISAWQTHHPHSPVRKSAVIHVRAERPGEAREAVREPGTGSLCSVAVFIASIRSSTEEEKQAPAVSPQQERRCHAHMESSGPDDDGPGQTWQGGPALYP